MVQLSLPAIDRIAAHSQSYETHPHSPLPYQGIVVSALARPEWLVEIEATAVIPE